MQRDEIKRNRLWNLRQIEKAADGDKANFDGWGRLRSAAKKTIFSYLPY